MKKGRSMGEILLKPRFYFIEYEVLVMQELTNFSMDFFSLKGKNALVTGGNSGLGRAFTTALAKGGANVFVPSIVDDDGTTRALVEAEGVRYEFMQADITEDDAPARIISECVNRMGCLDILVNSAGICLVADVQEFDRPMWDKMINLNLDCAFYLSREAALHMIPRRSGKIINICSLFSFLGGLGSPAYAAMKHGLAGLTKAYCDELGQYNIQVNGIAPGYYKTDVSKTSHEDPVKSQKIVDHIPAGRWGDPMDLMGAMVFLASRASDYVNGHLLVVDGGYLVR